MGKIAIIGSGFVGRAWAVSFARAGHEVALWDQQQDAPAAALSYIEGILPDLAANDLRVPCGSSIVVRKVEMRDPEIKRPEQTFTRHILAPVSAVSLPCPERDRGQL